MSSRLLRILILAHACWWFVWFAPSHQRGAMLALGSASGKQDAGGCCGSKDDCPPPESSKSKPFRPTPGKQCAVCFLVAKMDVPPTLVWSVEPLGFLRWLEVHTPDDPLTSRSFVTYLGRAPPAGFHG